MILLLLAAFGFSVRLNAQTATAPSTGDGSSGTPYEIATWENLYWISQDISRWNKHYIQTADIDLSTASPAITGWDSNQGWTPIGNGTTQFTGSYDGQGFTINGLYINRPSTIYAGLFGRIANSTISNLGVTDVNITAHASVGGLVGYILNNSVVQNSYSTGAVSGNNYNVGGLVGRSHNSTIRNSYSTGSVTGSSYYVGGLVGYILENSVIQNSYSTGSVTGGNYFGGLVGHSSHASTVTNSFWDKETSNQNFSAGGTVKTTAQMQSLATFTDTDSLGLDLAWDFVGDPNDDAATNDYWDFNASISGYPFLAWQNSMSHTIPAGNTNRQSFAAAGASVQFTTGNTGEIQLNIVRTDAEPNVFGSLPGSVQNLSPRYWSATVTSGTADGIYDITLDLTGVPGINDCATIYVLKRDNSSLPWQDVVADLGATLDRSNCAVDSTITIEDLSGFSDFVIGGGSDNPLPVELAGFSGTSTQNGIQLNWSTQSETNNAGFVVLRNGIEIASYKTSEALEGHGSTSNKQAYAYIDGDVSLNETYAYQLVSVDYSGLQHSYPQTVEVKVVDAITSGKPIEYTLEQNYPNPFNPSTTITYTMKKPGVATLKVYDMLGRLVIEQTKASVKGQNQINFNGSKLTSGMYYYQLNAEGFSKTLKMTLVK